MAREDVAAQQAQEDRRRLGEDLSLHRGPGRSLEAIEAEWREMAPEKRLGRPEEIAAAIAFLVSPAASFVRGTSLPVDGGRLRSI